jgi:hypothetical protein
MAGDVVLFTANLKVLAGNPSGTDPSGLAGDLESYRTVGLVEASAAGRVPTSMGSS